MKHEVRIRESDVLSVKRHDLASFLYLDVESDLDNEVEGWWFLILGGV